MNHASCYYKYHSFGYYPRTILSLELTNAKAKEIGIITIITAKKTLLKNALSDGVIRLNNFQTFRINYNYSTN